jgi:glycosyltransferase involved in cell wall biosynthesis
MKKNKINICALGDPKDSGTWSGTPYQVYSELVKRGLCGQAFDSDISGFIGRIIYLIFYPFYRRKDRRRNIVKRHLCARVAYLQTKKSNSSHTLHCGPFTLPFLKNPEYQSHYLLCDTTWHIRQKYSVLLNQYSDRDRRSFEKTEKKIYSQLKHIFAIGKHVKEDLVKHYRVPEEKVTVVGTGLGIIKPYYGVKDYTNRKILFSAKAKGRFFEKGGELVIEAFKKAVELDPELQLTIVGSDRGLHFGEAENSSRITTLGFVPIHELQSLFNSHTLFLMPALYEAWGLVYLEAMACKIPIVGLNRTGFPEISGYGKHGICVDEPDPSAIAQAIVNAYADPIALEQMGKRAQDYCLENYSWEKTVDRIVETIHKECVEN